MVVILQPTIVSDYEWLDWINFERLDKILGTNVPKAPNLNTDNCAHWSVISDTKVHPASCAWHAQASNRAHAACNSGITTRIWHY
jgi:hypothetical protein